MCRNHGIPKTQARVWLTTILDLDRETKTVVTLRESFPGRPDVVAREAAHRELRGRLSEKIGLLPKKHQSAIVKALVGAGFVV